MKQDVKLLSQQYVTALERHLAQGRSAGLEAISDDGKSFEVERVLNARSQPRLGRFGIGERVAMVGGRFGVEFAPGKGTSITAQLPLDRPNRAQ
jgi:signal transduction histidine kinase